MGIIGGADGPTVVFCTDNFGVTIALFIGIALIAALIVFFVVRKRRKK